MAEQTIEQTRVCTKCGVAKLATLEYFPPHKMGKWGLHSLCRQCKKANDAAKRARPEQKARQQAWRDANRQYVHEYNVAYRDRGYTSTEHVRAWVANNPERARELSRKTTARRRAALASRPIDSVTPRDVFERDIWRCYICGISVSEDVSRFAPTRAEIDHVVSVARGGAHVMENLRCCCRRCNRVKGARHTPAEARKLVFGRLGHVLPGLGE
jgi:5-methylcytosine-specific restriction endonuclease McrA